MIFLSIAPEANFDESEDQLRAVTYISWSRI